MNNWLIRIRLLFFRICETISYYCTPVNNRILLSGYVFVRNNRVKHVNFGDDLNFYLIQKLTGKKIFNRMNIYFQGKNENYLCIGSIIDSCSNSQGIIWGSGIMYEDKIIKERPKRVLAVRGPKTRNVLISQGIECPPNYGDPALLLPIIYMPLLKKKYKYGIIPHYIDEGLEDIKKIVSMLGGNCKIISMSNYINWSSVIDNICECEYILSSSLHGIIISDAYKIPNVWIEFSRNIEGNRFKFYDYFSSVNRDIVTPIDVNTNCSSDQINKILNEYKIISFNAENLLKNSPFPILPQYYPKKTE